MLHSDQAKKKLLPLLLPNKLSRLLKPLMSLQEMQLMSLPLMPIWLLLEMLETSKLLVKFHTTHIQLDSNGLETNLPADFLSPNILMDLIQLIYTRPTVPIPTEITRPLKFQLP
jgi:hypothetical protein